MIPESKINKNPQEEENVEVIEVNDDETIEVDDATGDVNIAAKLPPHEIYTVQWKAGKKDDSIYKSKTKGDSPRAFVGAALVGTIQDEEYEGSMIFINHINSLQRRGKPTSDLHHLLNVVGNPAPNRTTVGELLDHTKETFDQEPLGLAEVDWKAQYKNRDGDYIELKVGMENFPRHFVNADGETVASAKEGKWDGTYVQTLENPENGEDVNAQLYVRKHLTQAEATKLKGKFRTS
jgi:hypothetical protein